MSHHKMLKLRNVLALLVIAMFAATLLGQAPPPSKVDIFTGYSWLDGRYSTYIPTAQEHIDRGYTVSGTYFFSRNFGIGVDWGNQRGCCCPQIYTLTAGPTLRFPIKRVTPFVHALAGAHRMDLPTPFGHDTNWGIIAGTGVDVRIFKHLSLRLVQADYEYAKHDYGPLLQPSLNSVRLSTGVVWQFGGIGTVPVFPVMAACSVNPGAVFGGEPVTATATGSAFKPGRTIAYTWSGTGVKNSGSQSSVQIDTTGLAPGTYQVAAELKDGTAKGVASCTASFTVRATQPPVISCSATPASITPGGTSTITATASSPDGRNLTYSYAASAGTITGTTSTAVLNGSGAAPGAITVTCTASDDRNPPLFASSTTSVDVQAPEPVQVEATPLEKRLALHSIYFATAKPTQERPDAGLLASQEATLVSLATDFQTYLQSKPDARLTLEGHSDPRGSVEYNQALSERRVERTKRFLVEKGVPADHIQTEAFGEQQVLTDEQVKSAVEKNPELSAEERQKLLQHLDEIILASNRRVDVTLSNAGQKSQRSVREYPFNAADSLALLDTHETGKAPHPPVHKRRTTNKQP